jgi:hypothetical protein
MATSTMTSTVATASAADQDDFHIAIEDRIMGARGCSIQHQPSVSLRYRLVWGTALPNSLSAGGQRRYLRFRKHDSICT